MNTGNNGTTPDAGNNPFGPNTNAQNSYAGQYPTYGHSANNSATGSNNASGGNNATGGNNANGGFGPNAFGPGPSGVGPQPPYPPYFATPPKPRRRWSTTLLALTAGLSLILGGAIGTQLDRVLDGHQTADPEISEQQNPNSPQIDPYGDEEGPAQEPSQGSEQGIDQGTKVDSAPGVVLINTLLFNGAGAGTGMILDSDGLILTNYHVVTGSETVKVTVPDTDQDYEAEVLGHDPVRDVAVLQIKDGSGFDTVNTSSSDLGEGDSVSAIGNGSGQGYLTELQGKVTGLDQTITAMDEMSPSSDGEVLTGLIATDADVVPGYSGGPLVNDSGDVVGMTTAASQGNTSQEVSGYAVPISTALDIVDQVKSGHPKSDNIVLGRNPALGVTVAGGNTPGAQIVEVLEGSSAEKAGLKEGDTITALDGKSITDAGMLSSLVKEYEIGDTVTLTVTTQGGGEDKVDVKLSESTVN